MLANVTKLPGKLASQVRLLREDPERFAKNLTQFTNPSLFEERLVDVMNAVPMHVVIDTALANTPKLNVLDASWSVSGMTGGPNTMINLAAHVAKLGIPIRLVSTVATDTIDPAWFHRHAENLSGLSGLPPFEIVSAGRQDAPLAIGPRDVFVATHWTTAQQLKSVLRRMQTPQFFYMLQEFEPGFYAWSSNFALAIETYALDFWPIVNEALLADFLFAQPFGRLSDPATRARAIVFEPAVDRALFHPRREAAASKPRRLLFYARPTNSRNLFGLGLMALRQAACDPAFDGWQFLSIGSRGSVPELPLGNGHVLRPAPWMNYGGYPDLLRSADILLCPMLSPHTSYPVLEMVACGGLSVTNTFATKTAQRLAALSPQIIASEATIEGLADALRNAAERVRTSEGEPNAASLDAAHDWGCALAPAAARVTQIFRKLSG